MRIPRDVSGQDLVKLLKPPGYSITRQKGSHLRLTKENPTHHITIPNHASLRLGTLSSILNDVAINLGISKEELARKIFTD